MKRNVKLPDVTYLIRKTDDSLWRVTVPSTWGVTFGPMMGGPRKYNPKQMQNESPPVLRFYEGKQQRAAIPDVQSFRDLRVVVDHAVPEEAACKLEGAKVDQVVPF